ncbi:homocysteine S-methyltransferase family protein [Nostoc sp. NIES-2111]
METDGRLPSGQSLADAIAKPEDATESYPASYMINCAHPQHFSHLLEAGAPWTQRLGGLRANASTKSHAELDAATELDSGTRSRLDAITAP